MDLQVRGKTFRRVQDHNGRRYGGQLTEHAAGYVIQQRSGEWTSALTVRNPFQNRTYLEPVAGSAATPAAAMELAFAAAEVIEARFACVTAEREHRPPSRYDGFTPEEAQFEAQYDALLRRDRRRLVLSLLVAACVIALVAWLLLGR